MSRLLHQAKTLTQYALVPTSTVSLLLFCSFIYGNKIFDINELFTEQSRNPQIFLWQLMKSYMDVASSYLKTQCLPD